MQRWHVILYQEDYAHIVQELCESWGGCPGLSFLTSLMVSVDVKQYWTILRHWFQLVPNISSDIRRHKPTQPNRTYLPMMLMDKWYLHQQTPCLLIAKSLLVLLTFPHDESQSRERLQANQTAQTRIRENLSLSRQKWYLWHVKPMIASFQPVGWTTSGMSLRAGKGLMWIVLVGVWKRAVSVVCRNLLRPIRLKRNSCQTVQPKVHSSWFPLSPLCSFLSFSDWNAQLDTFFISACNIEPFAKWVFVQMAGAYCRPEDVVYPFGIYHAIFWVDRCRLIY